MGEEITTVDGFSFEHCPFDNILAREIVCLLSRRDESSKQDIEGALGEIAKIAQNRLKNELAKIERRLEAYRKLFINDGMMPETQASTIFKAHVTRLLQAVVDFNFLPSKNRETPFLLVPSPSIISLPFLLRMIKLENGNTCSTKLNPGEISNLCPEEDGFLFKDWCLTCGVSIDKTATVGDAFREIERSESSFLTVFEAAVLLVMRPQILGKNKMRGVVCPKSIYEGTTGGGEAVIIFNVFSNGKIALASQKFSSIEKGKDYLVPYCQHRVNLLA